MITLNKQQVAEILTSELGYDKASAKVFLDDYPSIHDELEATVIQWLNDRSIKDITIHGLRVNTVMRAKNYNFFIAIKEINRLLDNEISPEQRQKLIKFLKEPTVRW